MNALEIVTSGWTLGYCVTIFSGAKELGKLLNKTPIFTGLVILIAYFIWPLIALAEGVLLLKAKDEDPPDEEDEDVKW